jgi:hypothetical protein
VPLDIRQAVLVSERHGMRTAVDVELRQDPLNVAAHRLRADEELFGDLTLALAPREETQDLAFAHCQGATDRLRPRLLGGPRPRLDASKDPASPRKQLVVVERLHDVVVGADEKARNTVRGRRSSRETKIPNWSRNRPRAAPGRPRSRSLGKAHVEHDERRC